MAESDNQNVASNKWPWDWQKEKLTDIVKAEIVKNLAHCAYDVAYRTPEEVGMMDPLYGVFQIYCRITKDYFQEAVKKNTNSGLSAIATGALDLADQLLNWVADKEQIKQGDFNARYLPNDPYLHTKLSTQWDTVIRKFDICMGSVQQKTEQIKKNEETKQNTSSWKDWIGNFFWTLYEKTLKIVVDAVMEKVWPK